MKVEKRKVKPSNVLGVRNETARRDCEAVSWNMERKLARCGFGYLLIIF
jgi:hypothetical protein